MDVEIVKFVVRTDKRNPLGRVREKCARWFPAEIHNPRNDGLEPRFELLPKSAG